MAFTNIDTKKRIFYILMGALCVVAFLAIKLFYIQVIKSSHYMEKAYSQQTRDRLISPERGTIYDATGEKKLAQSTSVNVVSVVPNDIKDKEVVATKLAEILALDKEIVLSKVNKKSSLVTIADKIEKEKADQILLWIKENSITGVKVDESTKRIYPYGSLLSQVIGFTGTDNQGLYGLEYQYDDVLKGVSGKIIGSTDGKGRETPFKEEQYISPQNGMDIVLTVDSTIQQFTEKYLEKNVTENEAKSGIAIVMKPKTGEILAMANYPDFDLNSPFTPNTDELKNSWDTMSSEEKNKALNAMWRNTCISDAYEPGSIFKIITAACALEENVVKLDAPGQFNCTGSVKIGGWDIKCWRHPRSHGSQSLRDGIMNSCNPVFMQLSQKVGIDTFSRYLEAFGLKNKTGIDLPGETAGIMHDPKSMTVVDLATTSFGQTITMTPLQLINAVCAAVNGGKLMQPYIVKEVRNEDGTYSKKTEPVTIRQVVSEETSKEMLSALETVVTDGTAKTAAVKGYRIGGKTATAEQGRGTGKWYSSGLVGVAPANDPEICVMVYLYDPQGPQGHGGAVLTGPTVGAIMDETLRYLDIKPDYTITDGNTNEKIVPDLRDKTVAEAKTILKESGLKIAMDTTLSDSDIIKDQIPKKGATVMENGTVRVYINDTATKETTTVPDVRGKTMTQTIKALNDAGLNIRISGKGYAISMDPQPKTVLDKGSIITVKFIEDLSNLH